MEAIQRRISDFRATYTNPEFCEYLDILQTQPDLTTLYRAKKDLERTVNKQPLTKRLATAMILIEKLTLAVLTHFNRKPCPKLEFRFDWREICQELDSKPIYITDIYGEEWIMGKVR